MISLLPDEYPVKRALRQSPLRARAAGEHHDLWIVACWADDHCDLAVVEVSASGQVRLGECIRNIAYADLWIRLAQLKLRRGTWWLIGWRTRVGLELAGWLAALERGVIKLLPSRSANPEVRFGGRITASGTTVEIDLLAGRNKLKVLDFRQLGIDSESLGITLGICTLADAERTLALYLKLCRRVGLVADRVTAAQVGWARCRAHHAPTVLSIQHDDELRALERRAYHNGRCEAFRLGDIPGTTYSLDIRSCYASVCHGKDLPVHLATVYPHGLPPSAIDLDGNDHWIADVVLRSPVADYPLQQADGPVYPTGLFYTSLAWPELKHALQRGRVALIVRAQRYLARPALRSYAEWFLRWREQLKGSDLDCMLPTLKATFVASLGFTARRAYDWQPWGVRFERKWWIGITADPTHVAHCVQARVLDGVSQWLKIGGEPYEALPMLHATICSWARVRLLEIFEAAGRENILYVDTDGILVTRAGMEALASTEGMTGPGTGQLAERLRSGPCRIGGQKNYRIGDQYVCAGGVQTRQSLMTGRAQLTTKTGRSDTHGVVTPWEMRCEDIGDERPMWRNILAGQEL